MKTGGGCVCVYVCGGCQGSAAVDLLKPETLQRETRRVCSLARRHKGSQQVRSR